MRAFLFNRAEAEVYQLLDDTFLFMECREDEVTDFSHACSAARALTRAPSRRGLRSPSTSFSTSTCPTRGYDPADVEDVFYCGGVLGIAALTKRKKAKVRRDFLRFYQDRIDVDLIAEDYDGDDSVTIDEIVSGYNPFTQGPPDDPCPNPKCKNHKSGAPLPVLAVLVPEPDDLFDKALAGGDSGQLLWQVCERCGGVVVTSPRT